MALFYFRITCDGIGSFSTQCRGKSPYDALKLFLRRSTLNQFLASHPEWPRDFTVRDLYMFIPLTGLKNVYGCGLGQNGKYVQIDIVQTVERSRQYEKYCGPKRRVVTLRND